MLFLKLFFFPKLQHSSIIILINLFIMQDQEINLSQINQIHEFKQLPQRWFISFIYCLFTIFNGIATKNVPPLATKLQQIFQVSPLLINSVPMAYLLIYAIINLPANYFLDSKGIRRGLIIGSFLFLVGSIIELFVIYNFYYIIIGSIFVAISQPFVANCPAKIATFWFKNQSRPLVTAVLSLLNIIGGGVGVILPTLFVGQNSTGDQAKHELFNLLILQCSLAGVSFLLMILFMKNKPYIMPSLGSEIQKVPFLESIKCLWNNKNFRLIFIGFLLFNGPLSTLTSILNFIFKPFNFQDIQISQFGIGIIIFGILGAVFFSIVTARTLKYDKIIKFLTAVAILLVIIAILLLKFFPNFIIILVTLSAGGFFIMPVTPLSFDFGCQLTFPVGQAQVTGTLISAGTLISFILIIIIQAAIGFGTQEQSLISFIVFASMMFMGVFFYWLVQNDLKRRSREQKRSNVSNESNNGIVISLSENNKIILDQHLQKDNKVTPLDQFLN